MFISDFAIKRPIVTTVMMLALGVFGIFALTLLNTDEFPDVQNPWWWSRCPTPALRRRASNAR